MTKDGFHDECGVFGIYGHAEAARLAYLGLYQLQHRGQESCGIVSSEAGHLRSERAMGLVSEVFDEKRLARLPGEAAIGHTRYSTAGEVSVREAQPFLVACQHGQIAVCHNGNLPFATEERKELERTGAIFSSTSDTEVVLHRIARSHAANAAEAVREVLREVEGAFSMLFLTPHSLIAVRDPGAFARSPSAVSATPGWSPPRPAPSTSSTPSTSATWSPGEMIVIDATACIRRTRFPAPAFLLRLRARLLSRAPTRSSSAARSTSRATRWVKRLAVEQPADADLVVPVPGLGRGRFDRLRGRERHPVPAGTRRNHYVGRTFIEPKQSIRSFGVRVKLNPVRDLIRGKRVVLIDDSIVRGTTSKKIVGMVRDAGASEVHMRISCPPTVSPCYYGVDTPDKRDLIAAQMSVEEIRDFIGADSIGYLSLEGMLEACGIPEPSSCVACWTEKYPTRITREAETQVERECEPVPSGDAR
jgi:amidophosphoribosyltransferase